MQKSIKASLIVISICIMLMAALMSGAIHSDHWKISELDINAEFNRVSSEQIRIAIAASEERSFFRLDIEDIKSNLKAIPWVQSVALKKHWPNTLNVRIIEHKAAAIWNQNQLLNDNGDIFSVQHTNDLSLPTIWGSDNQAKEILTQFERFKEIIGKTGFDIQQAKVSPRGSWLIELSNGTQLNLGSQYKDSRLIRLVETWVQLLKTNESLPFSIDLRYTNGYAVKWRPQNKIEESQELTQQNNLNKNSANNTQTNG